MEVDEDGITAIWPLSSRVEIMEDLPDGGALVRVWLSRVRNGRISAETLAKRDDWNFSLKVVASRAKRFAEEMKIDTLREADDLTHWIDAEGNRVEFNFLEWAACSQRKSE